MCIQEHSLTIHQISFLRYMHSRFTETVGENKFLSEKILQYLKKDDEKVMNKWKVDENKGMKHENMNLGILLVLAPNHWSQNYEKYMKYSEENWSFHLGSEMVICLHPNISMHILYIFLYTFPMVLVRRICLTIKSFLNCR